MKRVRRRCGGAKAPIDDRAPHLRIMITYEQVWEQGRPLQVIARRGRQGAMAQFGAARRLRAPRVGEPAGAGRGSELRRQRHGRGRA
jgi:hypothetical protein